MNSNTTTTAAGALDVEQVLASATERTGGLTDFGDGNYRTALKVLFASLADEANLSQQGQALMQERVIGQLVNRLMIEDYCKRFPEILTQRIDDPVVIVGLPRTGSTLLQRLLAVDPRFYSAAWWETRYPAPLPDDPADQPERRMALACDEVEAMIQAMPEILTIHPLDAMQADEEFMLMEHAFMSAMDSYVNVPSYTAWLELQDQTPVYGYLKKMLQFLQWQKLRRGVPGAQRWLLKTPQHLHKLEILLKVFPQAKVVLTHRDPVQTIPSLASFAYTLWKMYSDTPDPQVVGQLWCAQMRHAVHHAMQVREDSPAEHFLDVQFEDTVSDPFRVIEFIYRFLNMSFPDHLRSAMQDWMAHNRRDQRAPHVYSLAQFGLSEAQIQHDFAPYHQLHIAPRSV